MKTIILLVIFICSSASVVYGSQPIDSIISLSRKLLTIHYNNPSEKENDSIINREMYRAFDAFRTKKSAASDCRKFLLLGLIYDNSYSLYTDDLECDRYNKRVICCWLSLALLVDDDRRWTFVTYAKKHLERMRNPVDERAGVELVEQLFINEEK